jgi:hypothetical protein
MDVCAEAQVQPTAKARIQGQNHAMRSGMSILGGRPDHQCCTHVLESAAPGTAGPEHAFETAQQAVQRNVACL